MKIVLRLPTLLAYSNEKSAAKSLYIERFRTLRDALTADGHSVDCFPRLTDDDLECVLDPADLYREWEAVRGADHAIVCPAIEKVASNDVHLMIGALVMLGTPVTALLPTPASNHAMLFMAWAERPELRFKALCFERDPRDVFDEARKRLKEFSAPHFVRRNFPRLVPND